MKAPLITFVIGAACGALGMFLANRPADAPAPAAAGTKPLSINPDRHEKKIASLEKKIAELESRKPSLLSLDDGASEDSLPKASVKIFGSGESKIDLTEMQEAMEKAEIERSAKRVEAKLATLTRTLNLSDEQAEKVRALLEKKEAGRKNRLGGIMRLATSAIGDGDAAGTISTLIGGVEGGEGSEEDAFDFDAELLTLLDDDQAGAYEKYVDAQNENFIEANANRQLAQLQTTIPDLSKEQKDQAFSEFARIAREDVEANGQPEEGGIPNFKRMMSQRKAETEAMKEILTPEQLGVYESNGQRSITLGAPAGAAVFSDITIEASGEAPIEFTETE